jgi:outer membrane protein TolC
MRAAHRRAARPIGIAAAALLATGCALQSPPPAEETRAQALGKTDVTTPWRAAEPVPGTVQDKWLATFGDPQLNALVAEAVERNPDLRVAATKVEQATEQLRIAEAARRPQVSIAGTGGIKVTDASSALTGIIGMVSWELDLWGRLRYGQEAAAASLTSVQADREFARQSIAATTAKAWFIAAQTLGEQQLAADMVGSSEILVRLAGDRFRIGAGNEQDVAIAAANLGGARDSLVQARYAHQSAARARTAARPLPGHRVAPAPICRRCPARCRPGCRCRCSSAARYGGGRAARGRRVQPCRPAKAAQLPNISLTGNVGYVASDIVELKQDYNNPSAGVGAKLLAPVYPAVASKRRWS